MKFTVASLLLALSFPVMGCYLTSPEQFAAPNELIARTGRIVLARVIKTHEQPGGSMIYTFATLERLKGEVGARFDVEGWPLRSSGGDLNVVHAPQAVSSATVGRSPADTDCQIHPSFELGKAYLVFLDRPYHVKSFERIDDALGAQESKDRWLRYVRSRIVAAK